VIEINFINFGIPSAKFVRMKFYPAAEVTAATEAADVV
jgi:hypothetical protein